MGARGWPEIIRKKYLFRWCINRFDHCMKLFKVILVLWQRFFMK